MSENEKELISFEEADTVAKFAEALYAVDKYNGYWSPFISNQLMQGLNNNSKFPTADKLRKALSDYKSSANEIQGYMEYTNFFDMIFARTVQSYVNCLAFDLQPICVNAMEDKDYQSIEYKEDKKKVYDFLNKFNYKYEFRKIVEQIMLNEVYYVSFRKTKWGNRGMKFALQTLPQSRCILDGYWEKGLLFSFDMSYFLQAGTDLKLYDPAMTKAYNKVYNPEGTSIDYRPSTVLKERNGVYAQYIQLSPEDGFWAFKFRPSNFNTTPFLAPFLKNALTNDEIQQLQYNKDIAEAYAVLAGEIATFDNASSGTKADQMVFKPETLARFMKLAKQGLSSSVKLAALPISDMDWYQYEDKNPTMYDTQMKSSAAIGVGASRLLYATDRMSNAEVEAALNEIYQTMKPLYYQFGNFLDFYVNKLTSKYKFKFVFDGSNYNFEREARFDKMMKVADKGIVLAPAAWASILGYEPQLFEASMIESKNSGWVNNLQMMLNVNTMSDKEAGRPKAEGTVNDSTERNEDM